MRVVVLIAAVLLPAEVALAGPRVAISPDATTSPDERLAAELALPTILRSCGTIEVVAPSTSDPGGWIIDCANGDRYRVRSGETAARFEKSF